MQAGTSSAGHVCAIPDAPPPKLSGHIGQSRERDRDRWVEMNPQDHPGTTRDRQRGPRGREKKWVKMRI
ncbi:hypothetical protein AG1IA_00812 [Rhizoctonia solani AG-1 IA]|uniref:Uncharacterized protein n=1 Tax=Thanatephorus cucumeris (strain AG1-IA) TaxID=983506 RepID=L8X4M2_THACA|nr:hypothetical protein AG1IA_00812 [Rhizoctonia solani AG-1 IA]